MFLDDINFQELLQELSITETDPEKLKEMSNRVKELLEQRILVRLSETLSEEDKTRMESLSDEELAKFFEEKEIDLEVIAFEEAAIFRDEMSQNMAYIQGLIDGNK